MTIRVALPLALAALVLLLPVRAYAQSGTALTREELEAQSMGLEMAIACNPRRQGEVQGSESTIRRQADALAGTAILSRSAEGTFLSLEQYDDALEGHCLVFGWFGGDLATGRYPIIQLSYRAMEEEQSSGERSFYAWGAVRASQENSMIMALSGTLEVLSVEASAISGTFELAGFLVEGSARTGDVRWAGSFSAVVVE
ncbi:MAG: hypothetical protein FJ207_13260 [Gemmatimonadetes bacterium]|nr:hypothetical protein [Gemmatimonadota bacterium]